MRVDRRGFFRRVSEWLGIGVGVVSYRPWEEEDSKLEVEGRWSGVSGTCSYDLVMAQRVPFGEPDWDKINAKCSEYLREG
jgi:hypothetical protein